MLPEWLIPSGHYSLEARRQSERLLLEENLPAEHCIPAIAIPTARPTRPPYGAGSSAGGRAWWRAYRG